MQFYIKISALLVSVFLFLQQTVWALETIDVESLKTESAVLSAERTCTSDPQWLCNKNSRLQAHRPNTAAWEFTKDDDNALEVNYSFRYMLTRPDCSMEDQEDRPECVNGWPTRSEWFLSYTGRFDFYMGTRSSGPVVNRISNPAIHWRLHRPSFLKNVDWLTLALEHRSNGQVTEFDEKDSNGNYIADQRWQAGDRAYIDSISRSANYFSLELKDGFNKNGIKYNYWVNGKIYFDDESTVTWGDRKGSDDRIWDYDVLRLILSGNKLLKGGKENEKGGKFTQLEYSIEYTMGLKGFSTDSINASLYLPYVYGRRTYFPINYLKIHAGPMNELSNYTEPQTSIYLSFKLNPYPVF